MKFIMKKTGTLIITLLIVSFLSFFAFSVIPGDAAKSRLGTEGTPKGVMLTHRNYLAQAEVIHNFFPCKRGETWLSVLPVWHSFERVVQYFILTLKCNIAYSKPVAQVMITDMEKIKPQWMCGVPRLWDAAAKNIERKIKKNRRTDFAVIQTFSKTRQSVCSL